MSAAHEKLRVIFSAPGWSRFIEALTHHRDAGRALPAVISLRTPTADERLRLARLLRLPAPSSAGELRYDLARISEALKSAGLPSDWQEILTTLSGPIGAEKLAMQHARQSWRLFWQEAIGALEVDPFPAFREWLDFLRRGTLKRLSRGDAVLAMEWLEKGARLLRALPLSEDEPLAGVAARYCGDAHALDPASPLATLVLRGLVIRTGRAMPSRSDERRELWIDFGVVCDELSAPVLTFNLALTGPELLCALVAHASAETQPLHLTTRALWNADWTRIACPPMIFICENPTVVSLAADQLGQRCPPLVCVDGEAKPAARLLLRRLREGSSKLLYHGDFDWPGVSIADRIFNEFGAHPWCFDAQSYRQAARRLGRPLGGKPIPTPWSPGLGSIMESTGIAYDEELLADLLLDDLERRVSHESSLPQQRLVGENP